MDALAFALWLECYYRDMAELCEDTPACRAFFVRDQHYAISSYPHPVNLEEALWFDSDWAGHPPRSTDERIADLLASRASS